MFLDSQNKIPEDILKAIEKTYLCLASLKKFQSNKKIKILFGLMMPIKSFLQLIN